MDKTLGKQYENKMQRIAFLKDNCDGVENKGYMKPYSPEELQGHKEKLANVSIEIAEIEAEMKQSQAEYKGRLKPLKEARTNMVSNIKSKAEYVTEVCYRFTDQDRKETGFYNDEGDLIECRPATADELQPTIFQGIRMNTERKTGTND